MTGEEFEQIYRQERVRAMGRHSVASEIDETLTNVMLENTDAFSYDICTDVLYLLGEAVGSRDIASCEHVDILFADEGNAFILLADLLSQVPVEGDAQANDHQ